MRVSHGVVKNNPVFFISVRKGTCKIVEFML